MTIKEWGEEHLFRPLDTIESAWMEDDHSWPKLDYSGCQEIDWLGMMSDLSLYSQPWGGRGKRAQSSRSAWHCAKMFKKIRGEGEREGGRGKGRWKGRKQNVKPTLARNRRMQRRPWSHAAVLGRST